MRWLVALLLFMASGSQALAGIEFCNGFDHPIRFAVAFQTADGWVSEGWLTVAPKGCTTDPEHANLTEFYWRGETDWYTIPGGKKAQTTFGKDRQFSVKDESFALKNADQKLEGGRLAGFSGPVAFKIPAIVATVSIEADGSATTVIPRIPGKTQALKSDPDFQTCEKSSGDEAIAACDRAIGSGKFSGDLLAVIHFNRGFERGNKDDYDGQISDYTEAIQLDPKLVPAYRNRGVTRANKGDYDAANQDFESAIKLDPDNSKTYAARGYTYRKKGDREHAIADYQKALSLNPPDDEKKRIQSILDELAFGADPDVQACQKSSGDEAIAACDRAIGSGKFSGHLLATIHINRGVERGNKDDYDGQISDDTEAIRLAPKYAHAYRSRGFAHFYKSSYTAAFQDFDSAIKLDPDNFLSYTARASAHRDKGDRDAATADYRKALSLNPPDDEKKRIQSILDELGSEAPPAVPKPSGSAQPTPLSSAPVTAPSPVPPPGAIDFGRDREK